MNTPQSHFGRSWLLVTVTLLLAGGCSDEMTGPALSNIDVIASTSGIDLDADGYEVTLDGSLRQALGINGRVTFANVEVGDHSFELSGVAANCTVSGQNPRTVAVAADGSETTFEVVCSSLTGNLEAVTSTTGVDIDPDGYTVSVDGTTSEPVGINDTVLLSGLDVGDRTVELTDVADNCTVSGDNPRTVTIPTGATVQTVQTSFAVNCVQALGDLDVIASTTGTDLDPDGYSILVDGAVSQAIGANDTVTFTNLDVGDHTVELSGLAANCTVSGSNPRTVNVSFNGSETVFDVACIPLGQVVFVSDRDGNDEIYIMRADGAQQTRLTNDPATDVAPAVSPDGTKIAFASDRAGSFDIWVMNVDGTGLFNLTSSGVSDVDPAWSPDGTRIAYVHGGSGQTDIYVVNADGSGSTTNKTPNTTGSDENGPAFSPDGTKIAFASDRDGDFEIYVMDRVGPNITKLTSNAYLDVRPGWSPDGTKLTYAAHLPGETFADVMVMNADGSGVTRLTSDPATDGWSSWSPDGGRIVFFSRRDGNREIYIMQADGSNKVNISGNPAGDTQPAWKP